MEQYQFDEELLEDEVSDVGSINHSMAQTKITSLLDNDTRFFTFVELSLDASTIDLSKFNLKIKDELVPDVCVYVGSFPQPNKEIEADLIRVSQMPDLAIEILAPSQSVNFLVKKIKAYFALGIKSCWLVEPTVDVVHVYSQPNRHKTYDMSDLEVVDEIMDIHLSIHKIFKPSVSESSNIIM